MELTVGPILFEWKRDDVIRFYDEIAMLDVDTVYLGEVMCVKKKGLGLKDIETIGKRLEGSGKKVFVSTLAIVSNEEEMSFVRELVGLPFAIEANDVSAISIAGRMDKPLAAGPHITCYNTGDIEFLKSAGVGRFVFPVELARDSVAYNIKETGAAAEVFAHGKAPLAYSWRCYTSRAFGLSKDECRHHCAQYPSGMELKTLDHETIFTMNGTSVLSSLTYTLIEFIDELKDIGVKGLRISPEPERTFKAIDIFRKRMNGKTSPDEALFELRSIYPEGLCNGWYHGRAGKDYLKQEVEYVRTY
ncbi:MAG: U32 family peptidase [Deltaproteobacteria bacterium]|nr:U32 family peptidase [Deltaproteobacteria bacterium]